MNRAQTYLCNQTVDTVSCRDNERAACLMQNSIRRQGASTDTLPASARGHEALVDANLITDDAAELNTSLRYTTHCLINLSHHLFSVNPFLTIIH